MKSIKSKFRKARRRFIIEKNLFGRHIKDGNLVIPLYTKEEIKADPSKEEARVVLFLVGKDAPTVVICPGGAYEFVSFVNEGIDFAKKFNEKGYNAIIVFYRVSKNAIYPNPMQDLAKAIEFMKNNSEKYNLDKNKFFLCGSSAGGHLVSYFSARYAEFSRFVNGMNLKPAGTILAYPVVSLAEETHELTKRNLLGKNSTKQQQEDKSVDLIADSDYPPTFIWHCEDDKTVPISNSIRLDKRLTDANVKHKFNIYPEGGHGVGLAIGSSAEGWIEEAVKFIDEL